MIAVEFRLKLSSTYSIRVPYSYQCARTYPLPAPSTIKGLCANALWRIEGGDPTIIMQSISQSSRGATSRAEQRIAVSSCTVRVIPMNALLRQFAFTPYIDCMIAFKDDGEHIAERIVEALRVAPVCLGDSESLVNVIQGGVHLISNIEEVAEGREISINSLFKFDFARDKQMNGKGVILYMQDNPCADDAVLERYIAPLKQEGDSYVPMDSISFVSAKRGLIVKGKRLNGIFCEEQQTEAPTGKPSGRKKKV